MNVLLINTTGKGTIAKTSHNIFTNLKKRSDVNLFVVNINFANDDEYIFEGAYNIADTSMKTNILGKLKSTIKKVYIIRKIKKTNSIDISISTLLASNSLNVLSKYKDKTVGIFHAPLKQTKVLGKFVYWASLLSFKLLYGHLDKLVAVSKEIELDLINLLGNKYSNKISVIYNIHDIDDIKRKSIEKLDEKYIHFFNKKDVILYVGNLYDIKAPQRLIKAIANIQDKEIKDNLTVLFVGEDKYGTQNKLERMIDFYKLSNIFFIGNQKNPYNFMKNAKILVSTSTSEGLPGVIIESLILNTPVVTTNSSIGVWEIMDCVKSYKHILTTNFIASKGIITSNNKPDLINSLEIDEDSYNLSNSILSILQNIQLYKQMKENSFNYYKYEGTGIIENLLYI